MADVERFRVYLQDGDTALCEVVPSSHYDDLLADRDRLTAELAAARADVKRLAECVKLSTEYRIGNPAFEQAVARVDTAADSVSK